MAATISLCLTAQAEPAFPAAVYLLLQVIDERTVLVSEEVAEPSNLEYLLLMASLA
jgi:hypothetical protein